MMSHLQKDNRSPSEESRSTDRFRFSRPRDPWDAAAYLHLDVKTITRWARQGYKSAHPVGEPPAMTNGACPAHTISAFDRLLLAGQLWLPVKSRLIPRSFPGVR